MENNDLLEEILDISDHLYHEMCVNRNNDHDTLFRFLTELGRVMADADRASFW